MYYPSTLKIPLGEKPGMQSFSSNSPIGFCLGVLEMEGNNYNKSIMAIHFTLTFKICGLYQQNKLIHVITANKKH